MMTNRYWRFICLSMAMLAVGCAANHAPNSTVAESPVEWGDSVSGLQIGMAMEVAAAPPGQPQVKSPALEGLKIYLKNVGQTPLQIVDPKTASSSGDEAEPVLVGYFAQANGRPAVLQHRSHQPRLVTLTPSQTIWFSVPVATSQAGPLTPAAEYQNADAVITTVLDNGRVQKVQGIWTGQIGVGDIQLTYVP